MGTAFIYLLTAGITTKKKTRRKINAVVYIDLQVNEDTKEYKGIIEGQFLILTHLPFASMSLDKTVEFILCKLFISKSQHRDRAK